tara:strand:+ start:9782 stop:11014 length:1233 start_codon:yes stop_codon:yes gene_type:complete
MESKLNYNIQEYNLQELEKLFNVQSSVYASNNELDNRIASILVSAKMRVNDSEYNKINNFLTIAKEKYKILKDYTNVQYDNIYPITTELKSKLVDSKFLDKNEHMIIEKPLEIPTHAKLVNIHSSFRDKVAFPYASEFEFQLPESIKDVTRLMFYDYNLNFFVHNIASVYQNNEFKFKMLSVNGDQNNAIVNQEFSVLFNDGLYTNENFPVSLSNKMNNIIKTAINDNTYQSFNVIITPATNKLMIQNYNENTQVSDQFEIIFDKPETYDKNKFYNFTAFDFETYWGLGYQLGFEKTSYISENMTNEVIFNVQMQTVISPFTLDLNLNGQIYLEIDGFNSIDQNNTTNSYFAKIPIQFQGYANDYGGFESIERDYERISKLKIRLKYANGIIVYTGSQNWDFTLEFTCKK